jgi:uncharacterized Ntn-hydrolase superfamily protein
MQMVPARWYGELGLEAMSRDKDPEVTLRELVADDPAASMRQVAMMSASGCAVFTGSGCVPASGHKIGRDCCAQGAMVESDAVWESMVDTFETAAGPLPERLLAAMEAGEIEGGDIRGKRAAAMIVISSAARSSEAEARPIDIRVDDHRDPLTEVRRQLDIQRHMSAVEIAFEHALAGEIEHSLLEYERIAEKNPDDPDVTMRYAIVLAMAGDLAAARGQLERMARVHGGWARAIGRLVRSGLLPDNPELLHGLSRD